MKIIKTSGYRKLSNNYGTFEFDDYTFKGQYSHPREAPRPDSKFKGKQYYVSGYISEATHERSEQQTHNYPGYPGGWIIEEVTLTGLFSSEDEDGKFPIKPGTEEYEAVCADIVENKQEYLHEIIGEPQDYEEDGYDRKNDIRDYVSDTDPGLDFWN